MSSNDDKRIEKLDCKKIFAFGIPKEIIDKNDESNKQKMLKKYLNTQVIINLMDNNN